MQPELIVIAGGNKAEHPGKDWATLINEGMHVSTHPADIELFDTEIRRYVDTIPLDATSVWLCCTHYPAIKQRIEARLAERLAAESANSGKVLPPIEVIDPMEYQAEAIIALFDSGELTPKGITTPAKIRLRTSASPTDSPDKFSRAQRGSRQIFPNKTPTLTFRPNGDN